jgi:hypothetical protein
VKPPWTINIHLIFKNEGYGEKRIFPRGGQEVEGVNTRKGGMRVNMVDVFYIHI